MTELLIHDTAGAAPSRRIDDIAAITGELGAIGLRLERWKASVRLPAEAGTPEILDAYADDIARLTAAGGYKTADVVRLNPDHPDRVALRAKFKQEHTHSDDEVRFFVEGGGKFFVHAEGKVYEIQCARDDLLLVPAGARHWFDAGERPSFTAIRLFVDPKGWEALYTGDDIADRVGGSVEGRVEGRVEGGAA